MQDNPWYLQPAIPKSLQSLSALAVQSASAMRTDDEAAYSSPNLSHAGFMDLQCPHQGARNLTIAFFPLVNSSKFSLWISTAPAAFADAVNVVASNRESSPFAMVVSLKRCRQTCFVTAIIQQSKATDGTLLRGIPVTFSTSFQYQRCVHNFVGDSRFDLVAFLPQICRFFGTTKTCDFSSGRQFFRRRFWTSIT